METQVKERLTGAIILVALVVLLVPELLTGPGRSAPDPSHAGEAPLRSYTVNLGDGGGIRQHAAPVAVAPPETSPAPATAAEGESLEAKVIPKETALAATPAPKLEHSAPVVAKGPAVQEPPLAPLAAVPAKAAHVTTGEPPPVTGWSIQLGSFQSRGNAERLVKQLKWKGFSAFILDGRGKNGRFYRVRVGPAADHATAATLAAKLRDIGQPGSVVPYP